MAVVAITNTNLSLNTWSDALAETAASSTTDGVSITVEADFKTVIIAKNTAESASATVTIKKGNGFGGVSDLAAVTIAAGKAKAITIDSSRFVNASGTNKGKLIAVPSATDVKFTVIKLPV